MVCTQDTASLQAAVSPRQSLSGARAERALLEKLLALARSGLRSRLKLHFPFYPALYARLTADHAQICASSGPSLILSAPQKFRGGKQPTTVLQNTIG